MVETVRRYLESICSLKQGDAVIAGVSGGADSVCLLCVLNNIFKETGVLLYAVHVNHNLRREAVKDQKFVESLCETLGVACKCYSYDVLQYAKEKKLSSEEAGRRLRYQAFYEAREELLKKTDTKRIPESLRKNDDLTAQNIDEGVCVKIAVAHTMDDNAETMLFHLFRGTGLKGLCGIPAGRQEIIRPLLCVRRREIEAWLVERKISWREDSTNDGDDYTRNRIRHYIIPAAEKDVNEKAVSHMSRTAGQLALAEDYLEAVTKEAWENCVRQTQEGLLILKQPAALLHPYIRKRLFLTVMEQTAGLARDISTVHVEALERLMELQCGKKADMIYQMEAVRTYEGVLIRKRIQKRIKEELFGLSVPGETMLPDGGRLIAELITKEAENRLKNNDKFGNFYEIPKDRYTKWFDYDKIKNVVQVRKREDGDYLSINAAGDTQKLKSYLINEKIMREQRDRIWLIADGKHIMWIIGYRSSHAYYVTEKTNTVLELKFIPKETTEQ